jgi:hypothetical protein
MALSTKEKPMSIKNWKRRSKRVLDEEIENSRFFLAKMKYPFSWRNRGNWHERPPQRHPGWAAYHANKDEE